MPSNHRFVFYLSTIFLCLGFLVFGFQNCGEGFTTRENEASRADDAFGDSDGDSGDDTDAVTPQRVTFAAMVACLSSGGTSTLIQCLESHHLDTKEFTQADVDTCVASLDSGWENFELAACMAKRGLAPKGYRRMLQRDVDQCLASGAQNELETCLDNGGILPDMVIQSTLDNCITTTGADNVEKCLRKNELLPPPGVFMQLSVDWCEKAVGEQNVAHCLVHSQQVPDSVTEADIEDCLTPTGKLTEVSKCLRMGNKVPATLGFPHIKYCDANAGQDLVAQCLMDNGMLEVNDPIDQAKINSCYLNSGLNGVITCLIKDMGLLSEDLTQDHIDSCFQDVGPSAMAICLGNSGVLPNGVTQSELDTCYRMAGIDGLGACLLAQNFVVTLSALKETVFEQRCQQCHINPPGDIYSGDLNMNSYSSILGKVNPGNPSGSKMYQRVISDDPSFRMPQEGDPLPNNEKEMIRRWILQGALDN